MERFEDFGQEDQGDQRLQQEASRFEAMLKGDAYHFFDMLTLEDLFFYYMRHNKFSKALNLVNYSLKQHPNSEELFFKRATVLLEMGKLKEARREVKRAMEINPTQLDYVFLDSEILSQLGKYKEAMASLEKFLSLTDTPEEDRKSVV